MAILNQLVDPNDLARLNDHQLNVLNDHLDGALAKELLTNNNLQTNLKNALQPVVTKMKGG